MERPSMRISGPVLDADDPIGLAEFYAALMGWKIVDRRGGGEAKGHPKWKAWALVRPESGDGKFETDPFGIAGGGSDG